MLGVLGTPSCIHSGALLWWQSVRGDAAGLARRWEAAQGAVAAKSSATHAARVSALVRLGDLDAALGALRQMLSLVTPAGSSEALGAAAGGGDGAEAASLADASAGSEDLDEVVATGRAHNTEDFRILSTTLSVSNKSRGFPFR